MLEEFTVDNFKSLINVTFRPREQNLLLGMNNAGKTNFCNALRFLGATTRRPLRVAAHRTVGTRSTLTNHYFRKQSVAFAVKASLPFERNDLTFYYQLVISVERPNSPSAKLEVTTETLKVTGPASDDVLLIENDGGNARLLREDAPSPGRAAYDETTVPSEATMLNCLFDERAHAKAHCFKKYLASWAYYDLSSSALRGSRHRPRRRTLFADGRNLASVIYQLKTGNERSYRQVLKHLQLIDSTIDAVNFELSSGNRVFMVFEDKHGHCLPAADASSGTLRFLALVYILFAQPTSVPCPLTIIEEPENGIYVGLLKQLIEMAEEPPAGPQVVFSSHSPYFIDLFDEHPERIFVVTRLDKQHSSITQPDPQQVRKRLETYPLGEQHFREMLG